MPYQTALCADSRSHRRVLARIAILMIALLVSLIARVGLAQAATIPPLQLPWPTHQVHNINGGYTYNCGDHHGSLGGPVQDSYAIDFALPLGSPVSAVASGVAHTDTRSNPGGYGNFIWIQHPNGFVSLYAHLSSFRITNGEAVTQGEVIGWSGRSGHTTGPHLHFSFRSAATTWYNGAPAKPEPMSGYTGFGQYGYCAGKVSPSYASSPPSPAMSAADATAFVDQAYRDLLGRAPDPSGLATWTTDLENGMTTAQVAASILASHEYVNDQVTALYWKLLDRAPDPTGLAGWDNFAQSGGTYEQVKEGFLSSNEYYSLAGGTNTALVTKMYRDILDRAPDPSGLAGWVGQLNSGTSRQTVAKGIVTSKESYTDLVTGWYRKFLRRAPDSSGLNTWVGQLETGHTDQSVISRIMGSSEYFQIAVSNYGSGCSTCS